MMNLNGMKRSALQKLAKQHGIKANMKTDKMIEALAIVFKNDSQVHFSMESCSSALDSATDSAESSSQKESTPKVSKTVNNKLSSTFDQFFSDVNPPWNKGRSSTENEESITKTTQPKRRGRKRKNLSVAPNTRKTRSASRDHHIPTSPEIENNTDTASLVQPSNKTFIIDKPRTKRIRSRSADINKKQDSSVPQIKSGLQAGCNIEEQTKIMDEIQKHIQQESGVSDSTQSFIPRFQASGVIIPNQNKTPGQAKWDKVHKKQFDKLESIDDYNKRKQERAQKLLGPTKSKRNQAISRLAKPVQRNTAKQPKALPKPNFMSPMSQKLISSSTKKSKGPHTQNKAKPSVSFQPVLSTKKMDLNFGNKASKLITPKKVTIILDSKKLKTPISIKPTRSNTPVRTPYKPINSNTPNTGKKHIFDLKESLKKPLTWVPHKGPLKQIKDPKRNTAKDRIKNFKQPNIGTRETRRLKAKESREKMKSEKMMGRRGIKS